MKFLVLILAALLVTGLAAWSAQIQGGEVIVHVADLTVRASLLMFLLIGTGIMLGFFVLIWLLARALETPAHLRGRIRRRRRRRADALLEQGLRGMLEDRPEAARKELAQAAHIDPGRPLLHLLAASAGVKSDDPEDWNAPLRAVSDPDYQAACSRIRAEGLIASGQWEEALAVLQVLVSQSPNDPQLLRRLARCYRQLESWQRLFELGRDQADLENLPAAEGRAWLREASRRLCEATDCAELSALWPGLGRARNDPEVLRQYLDRLRACGQTHPELEPHLRTLLERELDDAVLELYGMLPEPPTPDMVQRVGAWLAREPDRVLLARTLARLQRRLGRYEEARELLEGLRQSDADPLLYRELAEVLERLGESEAARACYREGLRAATRVP